MRNVFEFLNTSKGQVNFIKQAEKMRQQEQKHKENKKWYGLQDGLKTPIQ